MAPNVGQRYKAQELKPWRRRFLKDDDKQTWERAQRQTKRKAKAEDGPKSQCHETTITPKNGREPLAEEQDTDRDGIFLWRLGDAAMKVVALSVVEARKNSPSFSRTGCIPSNSNDVLKSECVVPHTKLRSQDY